ncbi:E3 ubiquitin-protein ligase RNF130-like [Haliotis rubra]|uniref:E3 ubiquitin-protein ligase RNF130-like n=1 Tax=Haliotis rubra TaxID=36100 RepID=UPI001EE611E3|nr:E3 ubiquitin-protein ligase RNF130-like [Haliotis rubra]XP_046573507.1 E3 ubiquitin-protein ligase RNF130-like [Haliotis rubra]
MAMVTVLMSPLLATTLAETQYKVYFNITYKQETTNDTLWYESDKGRFVDGVTSTRLEPVTGIVVHVKTDGCDHYSMAAPGVKWVALVAHGQCPFSGMRAKAEEYNASAIVVYGSGPAWKEMYAVEHDDSRIVAISVPESDGAHIADLADKGLTVMMYIAVNKIIRKNDTHHISVNNDKYVVNKTYVSVSFAVIILLAIIAAACLFKTKVQHPPRVYFERSADWEAIPERERMRIMH